MVPAWAGGFGKLRLLSTASETLQSGQRLNTDGQINADGTRDIGCFFGPHDRVIRGLAGMPTGCGFQMEHGSPGLWPSIPLISLSKIRTESCQSLILRADSIVGHQIALPLACSESTSQPNRAVRPGPFDWTPQTWDFGRLATSLSNQAGTKSAKFPLYAKSRDDI